MAKTAILSVRITSDANGSGFRKAIREIKAFEKSAKKSNSGLSRMGAGFKRLGASMSRAAVNMGGMATKASAITTAIGGLAAPLAAVSSAAAGAVGPMLALGAAMAPAAIGSAAAAFVVLKSAFSGFGEALSASDPAEFAAAIADMPPAAQSAATALKSLKDEFSGIGEIIQGNFWSELGNVGDLAALVQPASAAMGTLATSMGAAASQLVAFVSSGVGLDATKQLISESATSAGLLTGALSSVIQGIIAVGAAAAPIFTDISAKLADMAAGWADSMAAGFADGSLTAYFENAVQLAQQFFGVMGQLGGIISGVFSAMSAAGMPFLGVLGQVVEATNNWVNSAEGMATLQSIFSALATAVAAVLPIITQLAGIVGGTLAPVFAQLVTTIAPVVQQLVTAFSGIISAIMPIVPIVGQLAAMFGGVLAQAITAVTPVFQQLAQIIGGALTAAMGIIAPLMPILVDAFTQLSAGAMSLMPAVQGLVSAFLGLLGPIVQLASGLIPGLVAVIMALMPAIQAVITGVTGFISSLQPLISLLSALAGPVLGAVAAILRVLASVLAPVISLVVNLALQVMTGTRAFNAIKGAISTVRGAISSAVGAFNTVKGAIQSVINTVRNLIGAISSIRWPSPPAWLGKVFGQADDGPDMPDTPRLFRGRPQSGANGGYSLQAAAGGNAAGLIRMASNAPRAGAAAAPVINITVNGAIDTRGTAEAIRKVLRDDARTRGLASAGGDRLWR